MKYKKTKLLTAVIVCILISGCAKKPADESNHPKEPSSATTATQIQDATNESETMTDDKSTQQQSVTETSDTSQESKDIYSIATNIPKDEVESYMEKVKTAIINQDMETLYPMISYPIHIKGVEYKDENSLKAAHFKFDEAYIEKVKTESTKDMFCNYQGIMLGDGEVWINELLNDDNTSQGLKITAINE